MCLEAHAHRRFFQAIVRPDGQIMPQLQIAVTDCLAACTEEILLFYTDALPFERLVGMMKDPSLLADAAENDFVYHIELVSLMARLTEGANRATELKCQVCKIAANGCLGAFLALLP